MKDKRGGNRPYAAVTAAAVLLTAVGVGLSVAFDNGFQTAGFVIAAVGILVLCGCVYRLCAQRAEPLTTAKYSRKKSYITACEFDFLMLLRKIEPSKYEVLPQAALVSVIDKLTETSYRNELFRIIDYIFVDRTTFAPLLLVELNDRSHLRADRKLRDDKVNEICRKAKMPLVAFTTEEAGDFAAVKKAVLANILKR